MFKKKAKTTAVVHQPNSNSSDEMYAAKVTSNKTWAVALVIAFAASYILLRPYISMILLALLSSVIFNDSYKWLVKKLKGSRPKAAFIVSVYAVLVFGIPLFIILALAFDQALTFIGTLQVGSFNIGGLDINNAATSIVESINSTAADLIGRSDIVSVSQATNFLGTVIPEVLNALLNLVLGITRSIPLILMNIIVFFFLFTGLLVNQENIARRLRNLSPFSQKLNELYVSRSIAMSKAMLKGQLLIALAQGLAGATSLAVVGFGEYFVFFVLLFTLMNMIPLGSGLLLIPLGLLMVPFGFVWQGLFILFVHFVITTNIDNFVRPKIIPKDAWLPASLTIISALSGVVIFGIVGVVYGPIIMILITTTIEAYTDNKQAEATEA